MNAETSAAPTQGPQPIPRPTSAGIWGRLRATFHAPATQTLLAIVLLAAILRLGYLDMIEFKLDEARHLGNGLAIIENTRLPLVGSHSSLGLYKPPLMSYLLALPLLIGRDPRLASAFIALLNILGVAGLYLLAKRYYSQRIATLAALLLAVNPWAIVYSRKVFTADVLLPFGVLLLYGLHLALIDRDPWGWVLSPVALAIMLNITFSPALLVLTVLALIILYPRRAAPSYLLLGLCLATLISTPYLYYLNLSRLAEVKPLVRRLLDSLGSSGGAGGSTPAALILRMATWFHSGRNLASLSGASAEQFMPSHSRWFVFDRVAQAFFVLALASLPSLAVRAWSHWKERQDPAKYVILMAWLWLPLIALLAAEPGWFEPHYLVILYPASFLCIGLLLDWLLGRFDGGLFGRNCWAVPLRLLCWLIVLGMVGWQAYSVIYLYRFVGSHDTSGGYGLPLRFWQRIAQVTRREVVAAKTDQVWIVVQGTDPSYQEQPAILSYLLEPEVKAVFMGRGGHEAMLLPAARPGVYLLARHSPVVENMVAQLGGAQKALVLSPNDDLAARIYVTPAYPVDDMLALIEHEGLWALNGGQRLLGYDWPPDARPGATARLATYWTFVDVPQAARQVQHSAFAHVIAPDGEKVAQRDGFGLPERYWEGGLLLKQWFDIHLPEDLAAGDYHLVMGMYRLNDFSHNHFVDQAGNDLGQRIELGPVPIRP